MGVTVRKEVVEMEEKDIALLKSCIISRKGGVPIAELNADYTQLVGNSIPVRQFGFETLELLLSSIPGVSVSNGLVNADSDKSKHIQTMIQKQKAAPAKRKYNSNKYHPYDKQRKVAVAQNNRTAYNGRQQDKRTNYYYSGDHANESAHTYNSLNKYLNDLYELSASVDQEIMRYEQMLENQHDFTRDMNLNSDTFTIGETCNNFYFKNHQLIGDDFMIDLAVRGGKQTKVRPQTCRSTLSLCEAADVVRSQGCTEKVLIALGAINIMVDTPLDQMIHGMERLLYEVVRQGATPVLCTVPPLPNLQRHSAIASLNMFNSWLHSTGFQVVNLNALFKDNRAIKMSFFEGSPVQRSKHSLVYWSKKGLHAVETELERQLH